MLNISEEFIRSVAPNQNAITNGLSLVKKNAFVELGISADKSFIMGECKGSGASNYITSADFFQPDSPVFRCTCPSRQFPCKHSLGLMYAYCGGKEFATVDIPQDVLMKREKAGKKQEKQADESVKTPPKVNKAALKKKIAAQMEGLELLQKIVNGIVQSGLGTLNAKTLRMLEDQAKQLGNYYLTYPQAVLRDFLFLFKEAQDPEEVYSTAVDRLAMLHSLCKKGQEYLAKRLNTEIPADTSSNMEEMLGHNWQLAELKGQGLVQTDIELMQVQFSSWLSEARGEYIDAGAWVNLKTGQVHKTLTFRPVKATKYIRQDDSVFDLVQVPELFTYPGGDMNIRVRWENSTMRKAVATDYKTIQSHAGKSLGEVIKSVKNQLKNPLADKYPLALLHFARIGSVNGSIVAEDGQGQRIVLADANEAFEPLSTMLLELVPQQTLHNGTLLARFHYSHATRRLCAQPLTLITGEGAIRLTL
ncbi:hypothetical protein [Acetonema longum]|uniref:Zinc finger SWIM domain-containing protein n=1 Tax=Acetonema longum DSM 6540 TaxID=1009370 RepID=F7NE59_9FIRM|nr:hypothetical protein [Acetonema longum]EGO65714.1 zinc finger SWIM domain-containing protein [Acetonema longum DSM 6540]